ncbi:coagulation factor IX [Bufo bufo]|uniref:coagulation factor IX n=1 Tax=Bufo bufo TaxID=8384 RepID=UPI001ABE7323|nr:coagulation factor IX [Bufo bufo]
MASIASLLIIFLLGYFCKAERAVFLTDKSASNVLVRQKRYNAGRLEEFVAGNLERECIEEKCTYEEAREVFENDDKTMEFWKQYIDGDQCISAPCLHGGVCKDDVSAYVCWCQQGYRGKNCELALPITCTINNGGCHQMCKEDPSRKVVCSCASGYKLGEDGKSCEAAVQYPCGKVTAPEALPKDVTRSIIDLEDYNATSVTYHNSTKNLQSNGSSDDIVPTIVDPNVRIVGGTDSLKGEFPWQVHIVNNHGEGFCGGAIVNEKWIVTAAHCFLIPGEYRVVAGDYNTDVQEGTEQYLPIAQVITHSTYNANKSKYNNDIALVKLADPIKLNDYARPICIGNRDFTDKLLQTASHSWVTGWGHVRFLGRPTIKLQKLAVPFIDRATCKKSSKFFVSTNMFCAGYSEEEKDTCQGDSGGPHSSEFRSVWFLTGITSWGDKCAEKGKYGVYTRMFRFIDWILSTTKDI